MFGDLLRSDECNPEFLSRKVCWTNITSSRIVMVDTGVIYSTFIQHVKWWWLAITGLKSGLLNAKEVNYTSITRNERNNLKLLLSEICSGGEMKQMFWHVTAINQSASTIDQ